MASATLFVPRCTMNRQQVSARPRKLSPKCAACPKVCGAAATYKITFKTDGKEDQTIQCSSDQFILDAVEAAGIDLGVICSAGGCSNCAGKVLSGELDQSEQKFLDEEQIQQGYALLCTSYPLSDAVIQL